MSSHLNLLTDESDDLKFVESVAHAITTASELASSYQIIVVKIDNWFDQKWQGFAGKKLGAIGIWAETDDPVIPPFVPGRVLGQQFFRPDEGFSEIDFSQSGLRHDLHVTQNSENAERRKLAKVAPHSSVFWWSSNSKANNRGSLLGYVNQDETYWCWYLGFESDNQWRATRHAGLSEREKKRLLT